MAITVGIRELRDNLSKRIADVKAGETITVTEHGKPVAQIVPPSAASTLDRLISEGRVRPARSARGNAPEPVAAGEFSLSSLVIELRG